MSASFDNEKDLGQWLRLVESEYREMPGLRLTKAQIQRMWGLDCERCDLVLRELEARKVLARTRGKFYVRADWERLKRTRSIVSVALLVVTSLVAGTFDETAASGPLSAEGQNAETRPSLAIASMYGPDLFEFYCATCHGKDGKGNGPVARMLKAVPADLTAIAKKNAGVFPRARVRDYVTGDGPTAAHGSKEMPVWGPIFRALDPSEAARTTVRIDNLVAHVESFQKD